MSDKEQTVPVYVDFLPSHAGDPATRDSILDHHRQRLEANLDEIVARQAQLPIFMLQNTNEAVKLVVELLVEARELFCYGYHYSCVAMCGIVAERIIKDVLRNNLLTKRNAAVVRPPDKAFDQLEHVEIRSIINFAAECDLIGKEVKSAATKLGDLRNQYAHARGQNPEADALKAIECLHAIVDGTVSILKDFTIKDGRLAPRESATSHSEKAS